MSTNKKDNTLWTVQDFEQDELFWGDQVDNNIVVWTQVSDVQIDKSTETCEI